MTKTNRPINPNANRAFQISQEFTFVGKTVPESKKRCVWRFCFGEDEKDHNVVLVHSTVSGRKHVTLDGVTLHDSQSVWQEDGPKDLGMVSVGTWNYTMQIPPDHLVRLEIRGNIPSENFYDLVIDNISFNMLPKKGSKKIGQKYEAPKSSSTRSATTSEKEKANEEKPKEKGPKAPKSPKKQASGRSAGAGQAEPFDIFGASDPLPQPPVPSASASGQVTEFNPFAPVSTPAAEQDITTSLAGLDFGSPALPPAPPAIAQPSPMEATSSAPEAAQNAAPGDLWSSSIVNLDIKNQNAATAKKTQAGPTLDQQKRLASLSGMPKAPIMAPTPQQPMMFAPNNSFGQFNTGAQMQGMQSRPLYPLQPQGMVPQQPFHANPFEAKMQSNGGRPAAGMGFPGSQAQAPAPTPFD